LLLVGLIPTLLNSPISKEEENESHNPSNQEANRSFGDTETIIRTTEHHKERGKPLNDKKIQAPVVSRRSVLPKENHQPGTSHTQKKCVAITQEMMKRGTLLKGT
jgi:hypothetical protein